MFQSMPQLIRVTWPRTRPICGFLFFFVFENLSMFIRVPNFRSRFGNIIEGMPNFIIAIAIEIASISVSVSELLVLPVCTWWCSPKSEVSMPVKVDWACPKTLPQPLRSRNPGVDPFLDYYLYILEKFSICIGMPNFTSVALIVSKLCLRDCQIVHDSWSVGLFWCFMFHE